MFNVSPKVLVEFGLQFSKLLLCLPHVFLQLQTGLACVIIATSQSAAMTHLITCANVSKETMWLIYTMEIL